MTLSRGSPDDHRQIGTTNTPKYTNMAHTMIALINKHDRPAAPLSPLAETRRRPPSTWGARPHDDAQRSLLLWPIACRSSPTDSRTSGAGDRLGAICKYRERRDNRPCKISGLSSDLVA